MVKRKKIRNNKSVTIIFVVMGLITVFALFTLTDWFNKEIVVDDEGFCLQSENVELGCIPMVITSIDNSLLRGKVLEETIIGNSIFDFTTDYACPKNNFYFKENSCLTVVDKKIRELEKEYVISNIRLDYHKVEPMSSSGYNGFISLTWDAGLMLSGKTARFYLQPVEKSWGIGLIPKYSSDSNVLIDDKHFIWEGDICNSRPCSLSGEYVLKMGLIENGRLVNVLLEETISFN